jgi:hypothetical protein
VIGPPGWDHFPEAHGFKMEIVDGKVKLYHCECARGIGYYDPGSLRDVARAFYDLANKAEAEAKSKKGEGS